MRIKIIAHIIFGISLMILSSNAVAAEKTKVQNYDDQGKSVGVRASSGKKKDTEKSKSADHTLVKPKVPDSPDAPEKFDPNSSFEQGEVMVLNPPSGFSTRVRTMGYRVIEKYCQAENQDCSPSHPF